MCRKIVSFSLALMNGVVNCRDVVTTGLTLG